MIAFTAVKVLYFYQVVHTHI